MLAIRFTPDLDWLLACSVATPCLMAGLVIALLVAENVRPLRMRARTRHGRYLVNAAMTVGAVVAGVLLVRPSAAAAMGWADGTGFGLLHVLPLPAWAAGIIGFALMDATFYAWHRANHEVPLLWRFHNVHHVDPDLDVTTAFRFHVVEIAYSSAFRVVQVLLIGVSPAIYLTYEACFQTGTAFHHSNLRLPIRLERALNLLIVTPRMHGIHHSTIRDEANSNYGTLFRVWDQLGRSLRLDVPQRELTIGVGGYRRREDNRLGILLAMPFTPQREHWPVKTRPGHSRTRRLPA